MTLIDRPREASVTATSRLEHRPALDGLRGVAVAGVVAFHLGHLQGGFLGVDAFFTLSGYLITRLLLDEHHSTGTISFTAFWTRRAWRLLPALYVIVVAVALYALFGASPGELDDLRSAGIATLLFVANWWFIIGGAGYWDQFAVPSPLEHVWSLAIEQQFYVVWPLVVALVFRGERAARRLLIVTVALVGASTLWLAIQSLDDVSRAYFGSAGRSGSILVGAVLAIVMHRGDVWLRAAARSRVAPWVAGASAGAIAVAWIAINGEQDTWFYLGGYLAHAVAVSIIIAVLTFRTSGGAVRMLESAPLRRLGVVSYGLYLWHWPVIVIVNAERIGFGGTALLCTRLALSLLLAETSYRLIETPARRHLAGRTRAIVVFPLIAALICGTLVVATRPPTFDVVSTVAPPPPPSSPSSRTPATTLAPSTSVARTIAERDDRVIGPADDVGQSDASVAIANAAASIDVVSIPEPDGPPPLLVTTPAVLAPLRTPTDDDPLRVLLIGDSYMYDAQPGIEAALEAMGVEVAGTGQFGFTITGDGWQDAVRSTVAEHDPDLVIAMWARFDADWLRSHEPADYEQSLDAAIELLTADGAMVGFVGLAPSLAAGIDREPIDRAINVIFAGLPQRSDRTFYIDPDPIVAPDGFPQRTIETAEGELLVRKVDVSHYCSDGSARFGLALSELVSSLTAIPVAETDAWWLSEWRADGRYDDPSGSCR